MVSEKLHKARCNKEKNIFIIVPTVEGREHFLDKFIKSLDKVKFNYDLIVIRQYKISEYHVENVNILNIKDFGASKARNIGFKYICSKINDDDLIFFPDDDCYFIDEFYDSNIFNFDLSLINIFP